MARAEVLISLERQYLAQTELHPKEIKEAINNSRALVGPEFDVQIQKLKSAAADKKISLTQDHIDKLWMRLYRNKIDEYIADKKEKKNIEFVIPLEPGSVTVANQRGIRMPPTRGSTTSRRIVAPPPPKPVVTTGSPDIMLLVEALKEVMMGNKNEVPATGEVGLRRHRTFQISSADRDFAEYADPHEFSYRFTSDNRPLEFWRIELIECLVPAAYAFNGRPLGYDFYIELIGIPSEHVVQNDGLKVLGHFKCRAFLDSSTNLTIQILNPDIVLLEPSSEITSLHIRLLNEAKQPLLMENDIYSIQSVAQVTFPADRTRFTLGTHTVTSGEPVLVRGLAVQGDDRFFSDDNEFKSIAFSSTEVDIDAYRANVTYVEANPRLLVLSNAVKIGFRFHFTDSPLEIKKQEG